MLLVLIILQLPILVLSLLVNSIFIFFILNFLLVSIYLIPVARFYIISNPLYRYAIRYLPKISKTEYESLIAGNSWIGQEILSLKPNWEKIYNYECFNLSNEENTYLETVVSELCKMSDDWEIGQNDSIDDQIYSFIKKHKLWGLIIPKEYGGLEFSTLAQSRIVSLIASKSINIAIIVMVPNSLGPAELLIKYGTLEQQKKYLPELAMGNEIPCFGLTSVVAGSDASSIIDEGIICYDKYEGKTVLGMKLNWSKRYITLAPISTIMSIAVKLYDPDKLFSSKKELGITLCLIPTNHSGVKIGKHLPMNLKFPNGTIEGRDVFMPIEWVIGGREYIGRGWFMLMECLSFGRAVSLPALSTGISQKCLLTSLGYCMIREQFNLPIAFFEGVQEKLARIAGLTYIVDATNIMTTDALGFNIKPSVESAISKYHLTEMGRDIINDTMDVLGGKAIQFGPNNFIGFCYQSFPISITVEGANILTRNLIIFSQGIMKFHPYLLKEIECFSEKTKASVTEFEQLFSKHSFRVCALIVKNIYYNLIKIFYPVLPRKFGCKSRINYFSNSLAILSEFVLIYFGKRFKTRERVVANLGDVLSYVYISYAVIRYNQQNADLDDEKLFAWSINYLQFNIYDAFNNIFLLIPSLFFSKMMRMFLFPYGISQKKEYFKYEYDVVNSLAHNNKLREQLTRQCYRGVDTNSINIIEKAVLKLSIINPILKKLSKKRIRRAQLRTLEQINKLEVAGMFENIIDSEEIKHLKEYVELVNEAVQVDQF